ncbi:MAG: hypothetical protein Q8P67_10735 [archaeon]|nr:hypothetical protein [archaeon]
MSARDIYREGKPETAAYGYLARVDPAVKNMGTGKFLMAETIIQFGRTHSVYHGTVARTNLPQLKVAIVTRPQIGSEFQGEGCLYLVDCSKVPKVGVPAGARVARVDSEQQVEALWDGVYGHEGSRLRGHTAEFLQSPHHGGFWTITEGDSSAGLSIWNPDFGRIVDLDGSEHLRSIFYNMWAKGPRGNELLMALYSQRIQQSPFQFVIASVWRHQLAPPELRREHRFPEVPTWSSLPIEQFIAPHSLGMEEEIVLCRYSTFFKTKKTPILQQPCFFWDARDCSTLLSFHSAPEKFDF